jgi:hypothetical protein
MKDIYEILRQKEFEISRLVVEVAALRVAAPLLSDDMEVGIENNPTSSRRTAPSAPVRVPRALNANPQPAPAAERDDRAQGRP